MHDQTEQLTALRRPGLMVRAALAGMAHYDRQRDLEPILGDLPTSRSAVTELMAIEEAMNHARRRGATGYSITAHMSVLIALMAEGRDLQQEHAPDAQDTPLHRRSDTRRKVDRRSPDRLTPYMNASGVAALRSATKAFSASAMAGSSAGC